MRILQRLALNLEMTMVSVLHKELEYKVESVSVIFGRVTLSDRCVAFFGLYNGLSNYKDLENYCTRNLKLTRVVIHLEFYLRVTQTPDLSNIR